MLNIGRARWAFTIQAPTTTVDAMGAPTVVWTLFADVFAEIENELVDQAEGNSTGPRRELSRTMTLIIRCHPQQYFNPGMRAVDSQGGIFEILASRYNERRTTAYLDVRSGYNSGNIP